MNGGAPGGPGLASLQQRPAPHVLADAGHRRLIGTALAPPSSLAVAPTDKGRHADVQKNGLTLLWTVVGLVGHRRFRIDGVGVGLLLFRCGLYGLDLLGGSDVGRLREELLGLDLLGGSDV